MDVAGTESVARSGMSGVTLQAASASAPMRSMMSAAGSIEWMSPAAPPNRTAVLSGISFGEGLSIASTFHQEVLLQLILAPMPRGGEGVATDADREPPGPCKLAGNFRRSRADCPIAIRLDDRLVIAVAAAGWCRTRQSVSRR